MAEIDRLSTLSERLALTAEPSEIGSANLAVIQNGSAPDCVRFRPNSLGFQHTRGTVALAARVHWGGDANPLLAALPELVICSVTGESDLENLVTLMRNEFDANRCGAPSVVNRLAEVLIVRLLRRQIEDGSADPGLLAGLADPRISRAIVAIHDCPDREWRNDDLAQISGLSRSHFAETFQTLLGQTPAAYLRRWRLTLANQDLAKGHRIAAIARRYGYTSSEGFTRAYKRHYGESPSRHRVA